MVFYALLIFFFFNDAATTEIYTLSLHDALPISRDRQLRREHREDVRDHRSRPDLHDPAVARRGAQRPRRAAGRSEEHTSELQSRQYLVCRLLLEKKTEKKNTQN